MILIGMRARPGFDTPHLHQFPYVLSYGDELVSIGVVQVRGDNR